MEKEELYTLMTERTLPGEPLPFPGIDNKERILRRIASATRPRLEGGLLRHEALMEAMEILLEELLPDRGLIWPRDGEEDDAFILGVAIAQERNRHS